MQKKIGSFFLPHGGVRCSVVYVCLSVSLLVTTVSPTKTDEPITVPFGVWTWVGPRNHVLGGGRDPLAGRDITWGRASPSPHREV